MSRLRTGLLVGLAVLCIGAATATAQVKDDSAQPPPGPPAVLELLLPAEATASVDGKELGDARTVTIDDIKPTEPRRVKVLVKYPGGAQDEQLVDVVPGQRLAVPMPLPGPEKPATIITTMLTPVQSAALSSDGRYIAVALESVVVLWDTAAGRPVRTLAGHQQPVLSVAFSPDGKQLLTGSADTTAALWDAGTGGQVRTFRGHKGAVTSVVFSPDGTRVLTGSADKTAIVWKADAAEQMHVLRGHNRDLMAVAYSRDGALLATASADRTAALWDAATGNQTFLLRGHREEVDCVAFSPDGRQAVTGSYDDTAVLWDTATGKRIRMAVRHGTDVYSVAFSPDGRRLITGEREEMLKLTDVATGQNLRTLPAHTAAIMAMTVSPDGRLLLTGSRDGTAKVWDLATGRCLLTLTTDAARKNWAVAAPDGLFDAAGAGRHLLGFRFSQTRAGELDQCFQEYYRPGLLAEVFRGQWPTAPKPLGRSKPPLLKIVSPRPRVCQTPEATVTLDVTDEGGGVSPLTVENNGCRVAASSRSEPAPDQRTFRTILTVPLAPGLNKVRVRAASADGSWETITPEVELTYPRAPEHRTRMYVVAVGVSAYAEKGLNLGFPAKDAQALADLLRRRGGKCHDRVDVIPLFDREATKSVIEDTVRDVAELTRPQDTLVVLLFGRGAMLGDRLYFAPHDLRVGETSPADALRTRGLAVDDLAAVMGTARSLRRVLIVDAAGGAFSDGLKERSEFALRGTVERLSRSQGVYTLAAVTTSDKAAEGELVYGVVSHVLLSSAKDASGRLEGKATDLPSPAGAIDVTEWFHNAAERAGAILEKLGGTPQDMQYGTLAKGFPLLVQEK